MVINKAALDGIQTNFRTIAMQTFDSAARMDLSGIVLDMPITGGKLDLSWVATLGKMREWIGPRQIRDVVAKNFQIIPKHYEHTVGVDRDDIEDDQLGQYAPQIKLISAAAVRFMDDCVAGLLDTAFTTACYDGQPLCDDSHPAFGPYAAFDNKVTSTLSGDATGYANVVAARAQMRTFADAEGRNLGLNPTMLVVPSALQDNAEIVVNSPFKPGTTSDVNVLKGLKIVVLPSLSDATNWFLVDGNAQIAPLIRGTRKQPEFVGVDNPSDSEVFKTKKFMYGVDCRLDVVPGFPQAIVGSVQ